MSAALAASIVAVGLAGGGPLDPTGGNSVDAQQDCEWVQVRRVEDVRRVVVDDAGVARVVTERKPVTRRVKRCR